MPTTRKMELPTPATAGIKARMAHRSDADLASRPLPSMPAQRVRALHDEAMYSADAAPREPLSIEDVARSINWRQHGDTLATGDLDGIDPEVAHFIHEHTQSPGLREATRLVRVEPLVLVILCLAGLSARASEDAELVRRRLLARLVEHMEPEIRYSLREWLESLIHQTLREEFKQRSAIHRALCKEFESEIHHVLCEQLESFIHQAFRKEYERPSAIHKALLAELKRHSREF